MNIQNKEISITDDGIAIYDGYVPSELCDEYVKYFEERDNAGFTLDRWTSQKHQSHTMDDKQLFFQNGQFLTEITIRPIAEQFLKIFWEVLYPTYVKKFSILSSYEKHKIYNLKIQKTEPTQGYHVWHAEDSSIDCCNRILAFILYLNDVEEGGETEFLFLKKRVKPQKGKFLMFPAGFTHTHRGNPPLSGTKYILTGWVEF